MTKSQMAKWILGNKRSFRNKTLERWKAKLLFDNGFDFGFKTFCKDPLSFEEARKYIHSLGIKSVREWVLLKESGNLPSNIPYAPRCVYKNEWISWGDWFGSGKIADQYKKYRKFDDARQFARTLSFKQRKEWIDFCKSGKCPKDIPWQPWHTYKNDWMSMDNFLGTKPYFENRISFEDARKFAHSLKINSKKEWRKLYEEEKVPLYIPKFPEAYYFDKGWIGWKDFLGYDFYSWDEFLAFLKTHQFQSKRDYQSWWMKNKPKGIPFYPTKFYDECKSWDIITGKV